MTRFAHDNSAVVVVIGSGASGAVVANSLAQRGVDVVCLEAGRRLDFDDIVNNEPEMFGKFTWLDERIGTGDTLGQFPVWNCKTVGGTTMHWTATSLRLQPHEMRRARRTARSRTRISRTGRSSTTNSLRTTTGPKTVWA